MIKLMDRKRVPANVSGDGSRGKGNGIGEDHLARVVIKRRSVADQLWANRHSHCGDRASLEDGSGRL